MPRNVFALSVFSFMHCPLTSIVSSVPTASFPRRRWLVQAALAPWALSAAASKAMGTGTNASAVDPHPGLPDPRPLQLGHAGASWQDHGSHPEWNTEWWYVTGWARPNASPASDSPAYGFQLTFFRSRIGSTGHSSSPLSPKHLISAHLAVTDVRAGQLLHEERVGRAAQDSSLSLGEAKEEDLHVRLGNWRLSRNGQTLHAQLPGRGMGLDFELSQTQPPLVQGQGGLSRKGPDAQQISYYYSLPQLTVSGALRIGSQQQTVQGVAWLDHEWSTALMHPDAVGWDWIGMNLDDGSALTAFRLRTTQGSTLWSGGSWRPAAHHVPSIFGPRSVHFEPLRHWKSPASQASYPVRWRLSTSIGVFEVRAVIDAQELDARASTGAIYWEGLCALHDAAGKRVGWGYLEMTGYAHRLKL